MFEKIYRNGLCRHDDACQCLGRRLHQRCPNRNTSNAATVPLVFRICQVRANGVCRVPRRKNLLDLSRIRVPLATFAVANLVNSASECHRKDTRPTLEVKTRYSATLQLAQKQSDQQFRASIQSNMHRWHLRSCSVVFREGPSRTATCTILRIPPFTFPVVSRAPGLTWVWRGWIQTDRQTDRQRGPH